MKILYLIFLISIISYSNFNEYFYDDLNNLAGTSKTHENELLVRKFYEKYKHIIGEEKEIHSEEISKNEINLRIGIFYLFQKDNDKEAEKYFLKALNEDKNIESYLYLGFIYEKRKNYNQAEKYYLLSANNKDVMAMKSLGAMYFEQENYLAAEKYLKMATGYDDNEAMLYLANFYAILGYDSLAVEYFNRALEAGNEEAKEIKNMLDRDLLR